MGFSQTFGESSTTPFAGSTTPARLLRGSKASMSGMEPGKVLGPGTWPGVVGGSCAPQRERKPTGRLPGRQGEARASRQEGIGRRGLGMLPPAGGLHQEAGRRTQVTTAVQMRRAAFLGLTISLPVFPSSHFLQILNQVYQQMPQIHHLQEHGGGLTVAS